MLELVRAYYVPLKSGVTYARESSLFIGQNSHVDDLIQFYTREIAREVKRRDYLVIDLFRISRSGDKRDNRRYVVSFCRNGYKGIQEMVYNEIESEFEIINILEYAAEDIDELITILQCKIMIHVARDLKDETEIHKIAEDLEKEINERLGK